MKRNCRESRRNFPTIASYVELDKCAGRQSPWHWHKEAELFYMEQGSLEYDTPHGKTDFYGWLRGLCEFKCAAYVQGKGGGRFSRRTSSYL